MLNKYNSQSNKVKISFFSLYLLLNSLVWLLKTMSGCPPFEIKMSLSLYRHNRFIRSFHSPMKIKAVLRR